MSPISVSQLAKSEYISTFTRNTCRIHINGIYIIDRKKNALFIIRTMASKEIFTEQETSKGPINESPKGSKLLNQGISDFSTSRQQRKRNKSPLNSDSIRMWHRKFALMNLTALRQLLKTQYAYLKIMQKAVISV
jgi:hypothetical protein